jgi:hypothetical protein
METFNKDEIGLVWIYMNLKIRTPDETSGLC